MGHEQIYRVYIIELAYNLRRIEVLVLQGTNTPVCSDYDLELEALLVQTSQEVSELVWLILDDRLKIIEDKNENIFSEN